MKIKPEHYKTMKDAIDNLLASNPYLVDDYKHGRFRNSAKVTDLNKRFRWDLLWMSGVGSTFLPDVIYPYADDTHIDTALRKIAPTIERMY